MNSNGTHRLTQRDIALRCGVSQMTVSLALRASPKVSTTVRRQVMKAAKQLGWRPDPTLSALVSYRHRSSEKKNFSTIAWISSRSANQESRVKNRAYQAYFQGAAARAEVLGYKLEEFQLNQGGMTSSRLNQILYNRNILGLLLASSPDVPLNLSWDKFAAVTCGFASTHSSLHMASSHHFHSAALALRKLRDLGYRRIGVLLEQRNDANRGYGLMEGCLTEQRRYSPDQMLPVMSLPNLTTAPLRDYLARYKPDAVLTNFTNTSECMKELKVAVPADMGLAYLSETKLEAGLSGVNENAFVVGEVAIELVASMIQRNEFGIPAASRCIMIDGFWVEGRTVRRVNKPVEDLVPALDSFQYWAERLSTVTP